MDASLREQILTAFRRMQFIPIKPEGRIQEWPEDYRETQPGHRHLSHLWELYSGEEITPRGTLELVQAARKSLERRIAYGIGSTGWSRACIIGFWARLEEGDQVHDQFYELLRHSALPSLLDICVEKPTSYCQIDGNLVGAAGVIDMLPQSHAELIIRFLPALSHAWPQSCLRGIRARGGLTVDLTWRQGKAVHAMLRSSWTTKRTLAAPKGKKIDTLRCKNPLVTIKSKLEGNVYFEVIQSETHHVSFDSA